MISAWLPILAVASALAGTDISKIEGGVTVFLPSLDEWRAVRKLPFGLRPGDRVKLKPLSLAEVYFQDGTWIRVSRDAAITVLKDDERGAVVRLESGRLEASVKRLDDHVFEVQAPGAKVTLRADRASIAITSKKVLLVEVTRGLAVVEPEGGPPVQVPDDHRLEIPPGKAPGLPIPLREERHVLQKLPSAPPGANRKFERKRVSADPGAATLELSGGRPAAEPGLGADSLGIAKPEAPPAEPPLGLEALGLAPALGNQSLGIKEPGAERSGAPALGAKSLGLKEPSAEPKPDPDERKKAAEGGYEPMKVSTDLSPPLSFKEFGVAPPKPGKPEPKPLPAPEKPPEAEEPAEKVYKPRPFSTDLSPGIDFTEYGVAPPKPAKARPGPKPAASKPAPKKPLPAEPEKPEPVGADLTPLLDLPKQ